MRDNGIVSGSADYLAAIPDAKPLHTFAGIAQSAPIHIATDTRNVLMQTSETTS